MVLQTGLSVGHDPVQFITQVANKTRMKKATRMIRCGIPVYLTTNSSGALESGAAPPTVTCTVWPRLIASPASESKMMM